MARQNINFNTFVPEDLTKSTIDWGTVASGLTTQLSAIKKEKELKLSEEEDKTYEANRTLRDHEQYDNNTLNSLVIDASGGAQEFLAIQNKLYTDGLINQTDLTKARDRISNNFADFSKAAKNYDKSYKEYQERIKADPSTNFAGSSLIEQNFAKSALAFGNLKGLVQYVNPTTGDISLVRPNEDGSIPKDPSKHMPFTGMNKRLGFRLDKFNVQDRTSAIVDGLGVTMKEAGQIGDATKFWEGESANVSKYIDGFMVKDLDVASVLVDSMGQDYYTTTDLNDTKENAIHIDYSEDNQPTIIKGDRWTKQELAAKEYLEEVMKDQMDSKIKAVRTRDGSSKVDDRRNEELWRKTERPLPDFAQPRVIGPNQENITGLDYIEDELEKDVGKGDRDLVSSDTDANIQSTYYDATRSYVPPQVQQFFNNSGQGLNVNYIDGKSIKEVVDPSTGEKTYEVYYTVVGGSQRGGRGKNYRIPDADLLMNATKNSFKTLEEAEKQYDGAGENGKREDEFMVVELGGERLVIPNVRGKSNANIWELVQSDVINPAINKYNNDKYNEIYNEDMPGYTAPNSGAGSNYNK
jgi:hypothetical protein